MPGHERDRRPGERVADEDHVVVRVRQGVGDELGVPRQPRGGVFHRQVDRDRSVAARLELRDEPLPAPRAVPGAVHEAERGHRGHSSPVGNAPATWAVRRSRRLQGSAPPWAGIKRRESAPRIPASR